MSDTLCTENGQEPVQWTSLPNADELDHDAHEEEMHSTAVIQPPNKASGKGIKASGREMTLQELRASLEKQSGGGVQWNWDESKSWYYIFYTSHQATLVKSVNSVAAVGPYCKAVRGTPVGEESARIALWEGLTKFEE
jgi:hypothetical protein